MEEKNSEFENGKSTQKWEGCLDLRLDDKNIIERYETIVEAPRKTGVDSKRIRDVFKEVQCHTGGFVWRYADKYED